MTDDNQQSEPQEKVPEANAETITESHDASSFTQSEASADGPDHSDISGVADSAHDNESDNSKSEDKSSVSYLFKQAKHKFNSFSKKKKRTIGIASGSAVIVLIIALLFATHAICFHNWKAATCTESEKCTICGESRGGALGHEWIEATCTSPMTCEICGTQTGFPNGHDVSEWVIDLDSTCTEEGSKHGVCTVCNTEVIEAVAKKDHSPGEWEIITEATETSKGERIKKCTVCGTKVESESYSLTAAQLKERFIQSCKTYSFKDLARNAESLKGQRITAKGKVVQVLTTGDYYEMRVDITPRGYGYWTDTVYVTYFKESGSPNIIEDDIITFYGEIEGNTSYKTVLGATVTLPDIAAQYVTIE